MSEQKEPKLAALCQILSKKARDREEKEDQERGVRFVEQNRGLFEKYEQALQKEAIQAAEEGKLRREFCFDYMEPLSWLPLREGTRDEQKRAFDQASTYMQREMENILTKHGFNCRRYGASVIGVYDETFPHSHVGYTRDTRATVSIRTGLDWDPAKFPVV
jgi:hypothetical protein